MRQQIDGPVRLGALLAHARDGRNETQAEVASRAHVPRAYLSTLENGKQTLALERLFDVVDALGARLVFEWDEP